MFRLKATLVATTLMRPWRTGWSMERGVDFSVAPTAAPVTGPPTSRAGLTAAEPACFLDEDRDAPSDAAAVRTFSSPDTAEAGLEPASEEAPEAPGLRAWWSLAGKPSRT